jgi:hypothetical protein
VIEVITSVRETDQFPWLFGLVGFVPLMFGLLILTQPRKANEAIWRINQALRPWRIRKSPVGLTIAFGCLMLVTAGVIFSLASAFLENR